MSLADELRSGPVTFEARRKAGLIGREHPGATLSQLFFARVDLSRFDLSNAELEDCTVSDCDLREASLEGAYLHGSRFERCDFRGARLTHASLERVEFVDCQWDGALGFESVEQVEVSGLGVAPEQQPARSVEADTARAGSEPVGEELRFRLGHFASNPKLEAELEAHPDDEARWLVYADWLQSEGDLRGELITRQRRGEGFAEFLSDHAEDLFPRCADELRGGGMVPELELEWQHGFVRGATLSAPNRERPVQLGELTHRLLQEAPCRFIRRLSYGPGAIAEGEESGDYAPVVSALSREPMLKQVRHLEFGLQERVVIEYDADPLLPFGDLSELWSHVPHLEVLKVVGNGGTLGAMELPMLQSASFDLDMPDDISELISARWPRLRRFELARPDDVELAPLLHALAATEVEHLAFPELGQVAPLLALLVKWPRLMKLKVLDLRGAALDSAGTDALLEHAKRLGHLQRLVLTNAADPHEEQVLSKLPFVVLGEDKQDLPVVEQEELNRSDDDLEEEWLESQYDDIGEPEFDADPLPPNADLDIPDEHGD